MNCKAVPVFTTDEEMDELVHRDATTNITGFIQTITAPTPAGKKDELLFKFVVSNGNKKIVVLIWGEFLIDRYYKDILSNRIIDINGCYCKAASLSEFEERENFVPFELIVKENSEISFLGYHEIGNPVAKELQKVTFDNIHTVQGLIEIEGYVRTKFALIHNRNGQMSYGLGAITNGVKKVTIQIKHFTKCTLEKGDFIKVKGTVKGQDSLVTVLCDSMEDVKVDSKKEALAPEVLQRGNRPVKRIRRQANSS